MSHCSVCLDVATDKCVVLHDCGHVYHLSCIKKWYQTKASGRPAHAPCPKCKVPFDLGRMVTVYLDVRKDALGATPGVASSMPSLITRINPLRQFRFLLPSTSNGTLGDVMASRALARGKPPSSPEVCVVEDSPPPADAPISGADTSRLAAQCRGLQQRVRMLEREAGRCKSSTPGLKLPGFFKTFTT